MIKNNSLLTDPDKSVAAQLHLREEELAVINAVQQGLAARLSMEDIYTLVGDRIRDLFDAQAVVIRTYDHVNNLEKINYAIEKGERLNIQTMVLDDFARHLIQIKKPLLLNNHFVEYLNQYTADVAIEGEVPKSALFVPMILEDVVIGNVSLQNVDRENAFTESDVSLLTTLANSMTMALESARLSDQTNHLLKETEQRTAELAVINSVQEGLAKELDIQAIYDLVGNRIRDLFDAQVVGIATFDHEKGTENIHYLIEKGERYYPVPRPLNTLRKHLIQTKEKVLINKNFEAVTAAFGLKSVPGTEPPKSAVYVPLMVGEKVTGNISLQNVDRENAISDSDVRLLETLANSMSVALENARLFDETNRLLKETEQQKAELGVINSVQEGLAKELNMQAIYDLVGDRIRELFNAQAVMIVTFDHETATEHFKYLIEDGQRFYLAPRPYDRLRQHLIISKQKIVINSNYAEAYEKFGLRTLPGTNPTKSAVFVPLIIGDRVNSYISLQNMLIENAFSESDVRLLETLANSMSVALENARLFDETNRLLKETEQRTAELAVINSVQEGLARELDINAIYDLVGNKIRDVFDAQAVIIATFEHETGTEKFNYLIEKGERFYAEPRRYDKLRYQLIMTKQKILINKNAEEAFTEFGLKVVKGTEMPKSYLFVPLIVGNKVTSYVSLQNVDRENAFSESDVRLLETLANSMSVALENARLFDETNRLLKETEQGKAELAVINSVQEGLVREMDIQGIYNLVGNRIQKLFAAQVVIIATFDHEKKLEYLNYFFEKGEISQPEPRHFDKVRKHLIETGQNILINENVLQAVAEFGMKVVPGTEMPKSLLFMPLKVGDKVNGYVSLQNIDKENAFSFSDVRLLSTLANSMSVALENARLFDETNRLLKVTEQGKAELGVINSVQESLVAQMDMHQIYELVGEKIREIFQAQVIDIATYDSAADLLEDRYAYEKGDRTLVGTWKPAGFRRHVIDTGQVLVINEDLERKSIKFNSQVIHGEQPKSAVFVPMLSGGKVTGMVTLQNLDREKAFPESSISLLTTLANSMSVALESAHHFDETNRLLKETEQRTAELAVINSVQEGLAKELNIQGIYDLVGNKIRDLFDAQTVVIATFNHDAGTESFNYMIEKGERFYPDPRPLGKLRLHLIQSRKKVVINKQEEVHAWFGTEVVAGTEPIKSGVFVPLMVGDKITSYITLQNIDRENAFSDSDIRLLETLANSMSVALESARHFDETNRLLKETEQRNAELAVINSVQESLVAQMDMQSIYELVGEKIREIFGAQVIDIVMYDKKENVIEDRYSYEKGDRTMLGPREPKGFRKHVIQTKQLLLHNENVEQAMRDFDNVILIGETPKSQIYVPMMAASEVTGIISLQNLDHENAFSNSDVNLITTLANSMSVALESARLFDETNRLLKETEQHAAELAIINTVQEGLASKLDMQAIYELIGDKVTDIFKTEVVYIAIRRPDDPNIIDFPYYLDRGNRIGQSSVEFGKGITSKVIFSRKPLLANTMQEQLAQGGIYEEGEESQSYLGIPIILGDFVAGVVSVQSYKQHAFGEPDVRLLNTLASSMSVALENARLFDETTRLLKETKQRTAELSVINSVQEGLARELDIQGIYELIGEKIREIFDAQVIDIVMYDQKANIIEDRYAFEKGDRTLLGPREPKGFRKHVIQTKQLLLHNENVEQAMRDFDNEILIGEVPKSQIYVPLIASGEVSGIISLQNLDKEKAFSDSDVNLLTTLANSMSVALESARLFDETTRLLKETEQRTAELSVINSVQEGLAKELNIQGIYEMVGNKIRDLFDAQAVLIATFDHEKGIEHFQYHIEKGVRSIPASRPFDKLRQHLIQTRQKIVINKSSDEIRTKFGLKTIPGTEMPKSMVFVPLIVGDKIPSYVSLQNVDRENAFSESDVRLLETLSNSMSVALENARLFDETNRLLKETEQRTAELAVINSVQDGLAREVDIQGIYELVGEKIRQIFNAQVIDIVTYDSTTNLMEDRYSFEKGDRSLAGTWKPEGFRKSVIETGQLLLINEDLEKIGLEYNSKVLQGEQPKSAVFVPLISGNEVKGMISLQNLDKEHAFSDSDVNLLTTLANSMTVALESARLFDETNRLLKETEQRTAELSVINSVQEGLAKELDIQGIYELVGEKMREIFNAQVIDIVTYDKTNSTVEDRYTYEKGDRTLLGPRPLKGFRKHVIETAKPLVINKDLHRQRSKYDQSVLVGKGAKSIVLVPMIASGEVTGVISLQNLDQENAFSVSDVNLLSTLSNSMSVALESARLFDETTRLLKETEQRTGELSVINSVQEGLAKELDMQGIYDLIGDRVQKLFNAQSVIIATLDLDNKVEHFNYAFENGQKFHHKPRPINKLRKLLIEKKHSIYIPTEEIAKTEYGLSALAGTQMSKSLLFVPLLTGNIIRGYVSLQNVDKENAFSDSDIRLLETLANSMSVALENARLFDETNRLLKETEQRTAELAVINSVQEGLAKELDMQGIYNLIGDRVQKLFNAQAVIIATLDLNNKTEHFNYVFENNELVKLESRPINRLRQQLIDKKHSIYISTEEQASEEYGLTAIGDTRMPKSLLFVPMLTGNIIRGYVSLQNIDVENAFSESDIRLLETLANSMSVALENARLFDETNRLLKETELGKKNIELLSDIGKQITASLDFETIFYKLYEHINQLADATIFGVGIYNPELQQLEYNFAIENGKRYEPYTRSTTDKNQFPVWCIENRKPVFINDVSEEYNKYISVYKDRPLVLEDGTLAQGLEALSLIYLPLIVQDKILGIITIQSFQKNAYTEYHLNLLQNLATYTSIALDNANAYRRINEREKEIVQRAAELSTVNSISQALAAQLNLDDLIKLVGDQLLRLFSANIVYLSLYDQKTEMLTFPYQYGDTMLPRKLGPGLTSKIILTGEPLLINKDLGGRTEEMGVQRMGIPAASYLGVPIPVEDEIIGVLSVQSTEQENRFNENDLHLLSTIAASVGVAIRKAKLFEEVHQAKMEAEAASKTAEKANQAKSAFLSTVSHELRTPLTSVLGFAKIIKKRLEDKIFPLTNKNDAKTAKSIQQISENLSVVISEGERLTNLINEVLDLAKIEAGKMEWNMENVSMQEVAERAMAATTSLFEQKNLILEKHLEPDLPFVSGDRDKLIQVIVNLISNAVKFSNKGTVSCSAKHLGDEIIVSITDTGIGIAPQDHDAVFEQFKQVVGDTLTDKPKGTGLGLPICKEIVEHHGGRIWLESEVGKGSTFSFALPVMDSQQPKPLQLDDLVKQLKKQMAETHFKIEGKNSTILVVDDDGSIRSLLHQELSDAGYLIEEATNGKEALESVRKNRPDLIILDVMMPEMNGFDVAAILKNDPQTMDIPIIVLSIVQDKARGYRIGVDRYLTKPIDTAALFSEVGTLLEQGKSRRKVMVVDEDSAAVRTLSDVLHTKGYHVVESDGKELLEKAIATQPDIIILNSIYPGGQDIVQTLRFEKGLENVLFLIYQ